MSPSVFAGRVVEPGEPLWLPDDRADAIALALEEAEECPGCGWPMDESTDPDTEFRWKASVVRCHRCTARDHKGHQHAESNAKSGYLIKTVLSGERPTPKF